MRTHSGLCVLTVALALAPGSAGTHLAAQPPPDAVRTMLGERGELLAKIHHITLEAHRCGEVPLTGVFEAEAAFLRGKLDLCETDAERVKVHLEIVNVAERSLNYVRKMVESKLVVPGELLNARIKVLHAEIECERAKMPAAGPAPPKPPAGDAHKALLRQRAELLAEAHDVSLRGFKSGQVASGRVLAAQTALLKGRLDLCETGAERVRVYQDMVKVAEDLVTAVRKLAQVKQATNIDLLKAEVQLLEARIGLERAKAAK